MQIHIICHSSLVHLAVELLLKACYLGLFNDDSVLFLAAFLANSSAPSAAYNACMAYVPPRPWPNPGFSVFYGPSYPIISTAQFPVPSQMPSNSSAPFPPQPMFSVNFNASALCYAAMNMLTAANGSLWANRTMSSTWNG